MNRKNFLEMLGLTGLGSALNFNVTGENTPYSKNQLGTNQCGGPEIPAGERLYQGPFPVYQGPDVPDSIDDWGVVMTTLPSGQPLSQNVGMGTLVYIIDEAGAPNVKGETLEQSIEKLAQIPFGQKLYMRVNWKDLQTEPGKLNLSKSWNTTMEVAAKYNKRVGFRVMLQNPNIAGNALPDFVVNQIHFTELNNKLGKENQTGGLPDKKQIMPDYADTKFQELWKSFNELLAEKFNNNSQIEFMDTYMYGFWGEGHNWPIEKISFPDSLTAKETFNEMLQFQLKTWNKIPLLTNTQPDFNHVGNASLVAETLRTNNWLRTDTVFIENQQIEDLSTRLPWIAAAIEVGMFRTEMKNNYNFKSYKKTSSANKIQHALDVGCNYCSLWDWQHINADTILKYYEHFPEGIDKLVRRIGYRIRPSFVWLVQMQGRDALIFGLINDGISGVPGLLKLTLKTKENKTLDSGYLDAGYPVPGKGVRQTRMMLRKGMEWTGLRLYAELNVKGNLYPISWACDENINPDGSITLKPTENYLL